MKIDHLHKSKWEVDLLTDSLKTPYRVRSGKI